MKYVLLTQRVDYVERRNERVDQLDQAWTPLLQKAGAVGIPVSNRIPRAAAIVERVKPTAVILTGGNDLMSIKNNSFPAPERDKLEKELIKECIRRKIPLLGVCRGMQILGEYFGAKLSRVENHVGSPHQINAASGTKLPIKTLESVNSFHNWGFQQEGFPSVLKIAATATDGTIEALEHRQHKLWGIMWHPERTPFQQQNLTLLKQLLR